jgi:sterol desaturase/sphingolipid hydroxylase (fatty acid hydroxylase superfamily)
MNPDLYQFLLSVGRLSLWLGILVAVFLPLERLFSAHPQSIFRRGIVTDLGYYFLTGLVPTALLSAPIGLLAWMANHGVPQVVHQTAAQLPFWARAGLGLVAGEVGYYWGHRWSHEIPFLWRFHAIHHSAENIDFLVNTRTHPVDVVFGKFCGLVPIYILGLGGPIGTAGSVVPAGVMLFGTLWGYFIHANLRWRFGPLEWLISTPAFHHWHHTLSGPIDRNYSSTLPWLDWLFGTFHLPRDKWPDAYGVQEKLPESLPEQLAYPLMPRQPRGDTAAASTAQQPAPDVTPPERSDVSRQTPLQS